MPASGPDPFSLAEPASVQALLESVSFSDIGLEEVHAPVYYGPNVDSAFAVVRSMRMVDEYVERLDPAGARRALGRLRGLLAEHSHEHGVEFDSYAWLVTAQRRRATPC